MVTETLGRVEAKVEAPVFTVTLRYNGDAPRDFLHREFEAEFREVLDYYGYEVSYN